MQLATQQATGPSSAIVEAARREGRVAATREFMVGMKRDAPFEPVVASAWAAP
jgi:hypothetical protein